jgi:predicted acyl esterase
MIRRISLPVAAALATLTMAAPAHAGIQAAVFAGKVPCAAQDGVRFCQGDSAHLVPSFDGTTIDVNVTLPQAPAQGPDGGYPVIGMFHGWGGSKLSFDQTKAWAKRGYVVFTMSDRGWAGSCGGAASSVLTRATPGCEHGYNHLMDTRYEVRDAQHLLSILADEGVVDGQRVGVTGASYGGGLSMALAALKDRVMLPDGSLAPWTSPGGRKMRIAAAVPVIPWTDLAYSLVPNGRTLDYVVDNPYGATPGVMKASFVTGLYATGLASSNYALPRQDPDADLTTWYTALLGGDPYAQNPLILDALDELTTHHSSYSIDHSETPAPLLIANGWTDDLFPADEAIRFYNRTRAEHPKAKVSLMFFDFGHQRGQNKATDTALLAARTRDWFDRYLKDDESVEPLKGVETLTTTCPMTAKSGGPFYAKTWADMGAGEVRLGGAAQQAVASVGDPRAGQAFDPIAGGGACATADATDFPGSANYRLTLGTGRAFTLMGSPTIVAKLTSPGPVSQLAARLLDVGPDGKETLVARGLYRPDMTTTATQQVFQLHPSGWRFERGHTVKLELLTADTPYSRPSNAGLPVLVSDLELRLPTLEKPDGNLIKPPSAKVLPAGARLVADYRSSHKR